MFCLGLHLYLAIVLCRFPASLDILEWKFHFLVHIKFGTPEGLASTVPLGCTMTVDKILQNGTFTCSGPFQIG
jgi:hypothetical protein